MTPPARPEERPAGRLVLITQEQRDWLAQAVDLLREEGRANTAARVEDVVAAFDAAPADPAETVREAFAAEAPHPLLSPRYLADVALVALGADTPTKEGT